MDKSLKERLWYEIDKITVIDSHEHILPEGWTTEKSGSYTPIIRKMEENEEVTLSFLLNNSYCGWERTEVITEDWHSLSAFLAKGRGRGFYRSLFRAVQKLYNIEVSDINKDNWKGLSKKIKESNQKGWQREVLKKRANIEIIAWDRWDQFWELQRPEIDKEILRLVFRIDPFLVGCNRKIENHDGINPYSYADRLKFKVKNFDDYLDFIAFAVEKTKNEGSIALKCAAAYERSIDFQHVEKSEAKEIFNMYADRPSDNVIKIFGDYIISFIIERAIQNDLPIQIHTGMGKLGGSNPLNLLSIISRYPNAKFVLFHGGYPWTQQITALAFNHHNVYLDLVWLPILSPEVARRTLHEWIELVDADRLTWGGDAWTAEEAYGALLSAKDVICRVLIEKIEEGNLTEKTAYDIALKIFRNNTIELYNIY